MDINLREVTSSAVLEEKKKLRREFKYLDMIFYTVAALIGLDTIGAFSANGAQALTWLVISAITFLVPYALLTAELGSTFTQEGGMYEWCKMAGGRFFAALAAMLYWVSNPLWLGGTLAVGAIAAIKTFWFGSQNFQFGGNATTDSIVEILIALVFVWGTIWFAILSLRVGKYISVFGSYLKLGLLVVFVGTRPGSDSLRLGVYYANPRNRFYQHLAESGFTPRWRNWLANSAGGGVASSFSSRVWGR